MVCTRMRCRHSKAGTERHTLTEPLSHTDTHAYNRRQADADSVPPHTIHPPIQYTRPTHPHAHRPAHAHEERERLERGEGGERARESERARVRESKGAGECHALGEEGGEGDRIKCRPLSPRLSTCSRA